MVARGKSDKRVEPSFEASHDEDQDEFRLEADDRIVGHRKASKRAPKSDAKVDTARRQKRGAAKSGSRCGSGSAGGGLFAPLRRLIYWCVVLSIWGAIGIGGLVLYYGAQMPAAAAGRFPIVRRT